MRLQFSLRLELWLSIGSLVFLTAGCGTMSAPREAFGDDAGPPIAPGSPNAEFEQRQRERAVALGRQGRLAEASLAWEVLVVLRPDVPEYRAQWASIGRQTDIAVADRWQRALQVHRRGDLDQATQAYLSVLALQPDHAQAAEALRAIERERNKRNYLGKPSRITLAQRAVGTALPRSGLTETGGGASASDKNELEHAAMLTRQSEFDEAIIVLERRLAAARNDDAARALLADAYFQKAEDVSQRDPAAAVIALEKCLRLDSSHPMAAERLKQLKADISVRSPVTQSPALQGAGGGRWPERKPAPAR